MQKLKMILTLVSTLAVFLLFIGIMRYFSGESAMNEPAKIVCKPNKTDNDKEECFLTAHVHAKIKIFKNDKEVPLGYEFGNLDRNHIHAQKNTLHWHGLIKIDEKPKNLPSFKELSNFDVFKLGYILKDLNITYERKPRYILNGKQATKNDTWKAGDTIEIYYEGK